MLITDNVGKIVPQPILIQPSAAAQQIKQNCLPNTNKASIHKIKFIYKEITSD